MAHPFQHLKAHKVEKSRVSSIAHRASGGRVHSDEAEDKALIKKAVKGAALKEVFSGGKKPKQRADKKKRKRANGGSLAGYEEAATDPAIRALQTGKPVAMPTVKSDTKSPSMDADTSVGDKPDFLRGKVARKRGGRVGKGKTVVNINMAPPAPPMLAPPMPPPPGAMPIGGPGAMAAKPPMGPPPGAGGPPPGLGGPDGPMPPMPMRARGGRIDTGTKVSHDKGKSDKPSDLHRGRVITFATGGGVKTFRAYGGKVEAPGPGKGMGPDLKGGVVTGEARLQQASRAKRR